jgi:hypothetical protein
MTKTPYRIIYLVQGQDRYNSWEFDDTKYETVEAAFDVALEKYFAQAFHVVRLCYPEED